MVEEDEEEENVPIDILDQLTEMKISAYLRGRDATMWRVTVSVIRVLCLHCVQ